MGVSGAFNPKNDNTSSPPTAFVFGNGFISSTGALFLNIPLESCEKSVYVFPMISVFKNWLALFLDLFDSLVRFHNKGHGKPSKPCAYARESQYRQEPLSRIVSVVDVLSCVDIFRQRIFMLHPYMNCMSFR